MSQIVGWSAVETVARLKAREVSAEEVVTAHLERLDAVNPALNAVVDTVPDALDRARAIDAGRVDPGILHGAPVTTKVNTDQEGLANTNGMAAFAGNIAPADAPVVRNLQAAGGVVVGRTNTPEMSMRWFTSNPLHGLTRNPWDDRVTPGGSSGGASAAVAAGIGVIAHGNDVGGSVRYPAYCCGLAGLRPSRGRVPAFNPSAKANRAPMTTAMSVQGPLARGVADLRLGLAAMRGFSVDDPDWTAAAGNGRPAAGRIGIAQDYRADARHPHVSEAMSRAESAAAEAGIEVVPVALPETDRIARLWGQLIFTEWSVMSQPDVVTHGSPEAVRWLDQFAAHFGTLDLEGYIRGVAERTALQRAWGHLFAGVDALILPTSLVPPFETDLDFRAPDRAAEIIVAQEPLYLVNFLGLPAVSIPTHVADGLPSGVQIVGPMHDDDAVLDIAERMERVLGGVLDRMPPPPAA